ncbi:MAG: DNA repair exonuclease [Rhizobiaceae bacterium]|nr:DNA repair exonuclease [Rhizobiaceae bacterium]
MYRFIHSSDLHLGKGFGNFEGDLPGRLREARHAVLAKLAEQARRSGADTILLAGDTFDSETPAAHVRRQALAEMKHHDTIRWVILPGNHDSLQAAQLWTALGSEAPENVTLAVEAQPLQLAPDVMLLPAPCTTRRPGRDLTEWMDGQSSSPETIRIGLAHGAVQSFSENASFADIIAPDRAGRAGLDYLALGDWHGALEIDPRTRYSGAPEPDRFKHERPGEALLVNIAGPGAVPQVTTFPTQSFSWHTLNLHLLSGEDAVTSLGDVLPDSRERRQTLLRLVVSGHCRLNDRTRLATAIASATPDFAFVDFDDSGLFTDCEADDLDMIDRGGALREAANALLAEASDHTRSAAERDIARAALTRLFSYAQEVGS